ncbi:hypothetical protein N1F89_19015 [Aquibium sp. A9E412]|uniref:hypothetical protein n=1 Tax=Aquibium sp. A9E412 TaxID=2976767 RepID=UPI0025B14AD1|nr:hypothetical protein [Aquibium sp. A9E412]MDN2568321.1 hypothetical protein [Aquibium sp. A9E412]
MQSSEATDVERLGAELARRDETVAALERMVERQMAMLDRYEAVARKAAPETSQGERRGALGAEAVERVLELLDRAIVRAEQLTRDKAALQGSLDRTLTLLEESLRNQEALTRARPAAQPAAGEATVPADVAATLAKYDTMLERSLDALERAYRASSDSKKEIEERDRLLARTLDALENAVGAAPEPAGRRSFLRLFG